MRSYNHSIFFHSFLTLPPSWRTRFQRDHSSIRRKKRKNEIESSFKKHSSVSLSNSLWDEREQVTLATIKIPKLIKPLTDKVLQAHKTTQRHPQPPKILQTFLSEQVANLRRLDLVKIR